MTYPFLADLCESRLFPSHTMLRHWKSSKLAELCYLYFIGLRILLGSDATQAWAQGYCGDAGEPNNFNSWRGDANDLYVMLFALHDDEHLPLSPNLIRTWLRHISTHDDKDATHRLFMRLDGMFHINNGNMKAIRRQVLNWDDIDSRGRHDVLIKLINLIHERAPSNSEILPHLKRVAALRESASSGATGAANVATVVGGLGAGFDPKGDRGIYSKKKPVVIKRRT